VIVPVERDLKGLILKSARKKEKVTEKRLLFLSLQVKLLMKKS